MMLADVFAQMMKKGDGKVGPDDAARMAAKGRNGDSIIAHINPREAAILKALGGSGTINPDTGAMEFYEEGEGDQPGGQYGGSDPTGGYADKSYGGYDTSGLGGYGGLGNVSSANDIGSAFGNTGNGGGSNFSLGGYVEAGPSYTRDVSMVAPSAGSFVTPSYGQTATDVAQQMKDAAGTIGSYASPGAADPKSNVYGGGSPNSGDNLGGLAQSVANAYGGIAGTVGDYGSTAGSIAGSGLYGDAGTGNADVNAGNPSSPTAVGGAATPSAGAIAPDATQGWNPLSSWQDTFAPAEQGQQQALARTEQGEVVYGENAPSLGNLRGMRDNMNFQTDGFNIPGIEGQVEQGVSTLGDPEKPNAATAPAASPRGDGVVSTWSGVGPAGFGIGDPDAMTNAAATPNPNAPNMGSAPMDGYGARTPQVTNNYRDPSTFSAPMADAVSRAYDANPDIPNGYLEGMYGIESGYGRNMHTPGSSYYGPMQFSQASMDYAAPQLAPVSKMDLYDPYNNMQAMSGELASMKAALGRNPTAEEAYAMHQQGVTGGARAINDPYASMTDLGTPARNLTANGLPADANYRDFIEKFGTPFGQQMNYSPDVSIQGPVGIGSMFR